MMNERQAVSLLSETAYSMLKKYHEVQADFLATFGADEDHFVRLDDECDRIHTRIGYLTHVALGGDPDGD